METLKKSLDAERGRINVRLASGNDISHQFSGAGRHRNTLHPMAGSHQ